MKRRLTDDERAAHKKIKEAKRELKAATKRATTCYYCKKKIGGKLTRPGYSTTDTEHTVYICKRKACLEKLLDFNRAWNEW